MKRASSKDAGKVGIVEKGPRANANFSTSAQKQNSMIILPLLICFRLINALCVNTFFQPDEYFQSLEPAWQMAFGRQSGAWITWEWQHQLRSSLHPVIFGALYLVSEKLMDSLGCLPQSKATVLIVMPKIMQGLFAAMGDYFTWKLAERIYGRSSKSAWTALILTLLSPWQWFCSTRTLSNSLEMVLTTVALSFWPWELAGSSVLEPSKSDQNRSTINRPTVLGKYANVFNLRLCLIFAGIACILRPTNLLIWASLVTIMLTRVALNEGLAHKQDLLIFFREAVTCGTFVICASAISDRLYFKLWTFPPYQWLNFNINQSLAVFYGTNDWHYYLSQGLPLLLTTYLPFAIQALWSSSSLVSADLPSAVTSIRWDLTFVVLGMITTLSVISHKEVRFIYPLLPCLHVLAAPHAVSFFNGRPFISGLLKSSNEAPMRIKSRRLPLVILLVIINISIAFYTTQVHQRGVIDVLAILRHEYEEVHLSRGGLSPVHTKPSQAIGKHRQEDNSIEVFAAFLMPCHSTPWRSHLVYPNLHAWALTCEPPLNIPANTPERASYQDEADRFYDDPDLFLRTEMNTTERRWPRYIVGFQGIEKPLKDYLRAQVPGRKIEERWSGFNSHWHDDSRRKGRVVIWEMVERSGIEQ